MPKKLISALLCLLLLLAAAPPAGAAVFHSDVRVLLSTGGVQSLSVSLSGEYYIEEAPDIILTSVRVDFSISGNRPMLTLSPQAEGEDDGQEEALRFTASSITLCSKDYGGTSCLFTLDNARYGETDYLGNLRVTVSEGSLRFINVLPTEQYLYGVVPHEMSNTFPLEALKAQAVCARGYAVAKCSSYASRAYDLGDTSSDQVYHGYQPEYTRAIAAVDETYGQVLTYEGEIIEAYYSASNGGQTEKTGNVWRSDLPYYVYRDDPFDLSNPSSLEEKSFIPAVFNESTIALMDGPVYEALLQGAIGAVGERVTLLSTVRVKAHTAKYDPPSRCYTLADVTLMVETAMAERGQVTVTLVLDDFVASDDNPTGIFNLSRSLRMRGAEAGSLVTEEGNRHEGYFLTNRRWGHGVGLSQRGAQQRATEGQLSNDILSFYYADTALVTVGSHADAPTLASSVHRVAQDRIDGLEPGLRAEELLAGLSAEGAEIRLISASGSLREAAEGESITLRTGDFIRLIYGEALNSYFDIPLVIYGDLNGDGAVDGSDVESLLNHLLSVKSLSGAYLMAADINHDGLVDIQDALLLQKHLQGAYDIQQQGGSEA